MYLPFAEVTRGPPLSPLHESTPPTPNTPAHCILPFVRLNRLFGQFSVPPLKKAWQAPRVYRFTCACCGVVAMWSVRSGRQVGLLLDQANTAPALPSGLCSGYTNGCLRGAASCHAVAFHPSLPMVVTVGGGPPAGTAESCCAMGIDAGACCDADDARDHQHVHLYVPGGPTATSHGGGDGDGDHAME